VSLGAPAELSASNSSCACIAGDENGDDRIREDDYAGWSLRLQYPGFVLSLVAMSVPIIQLIEQRAVTPGINLVKKKGGSPLALLAAAYMLLATLPKKLAALISQGESGTADAAGAAKSADADAGDEVGDEVGDDRQDAEGCEGEEPDKIGLEGDVAANTSLGVSRLLARALAAKEVTGKKIAAPEGAPPQLPNTQSSLSMMMDSHGGYAAAAAELRRQQQQEAARQQMLADDGGDDVDDGDDGGDI